MGIFILSTAIIFPSHATAAEDYLLSVDMNEGSTSDSSVLVPSSALVKKLRFQIPRENPDKLIVQILLKNSLPANQTFPDSKWILGFWLYAPSIYCSGSGTCDYVLQVQPSYGNQAFIYAYKEKIEYDKGVLSDCKAPWYIKKDSDGVSAVAIELSITCLNISSSFAAYAFSSIDIGVTPRPYQFTAPNYVDNPYRQLAEKSYLANGGKNGLGKVVGSPDFENLKSTVESAREVFDSLVDRYGTLATETQKKISKNAEWKNFLKLEDQLFEIENNLDSFTFSTNAEKLKAVVAIQNMISLKTKALQLQLSVFPQYQCYNEIKGLTKALSASKSCPKGYKKVKT